MEKGHETNIPDVGPLIDDYPDKWDLFTDKGYQGATEMVRVVHPVKLSKTELYLGRRKGSIAKWQLIKSV